MDKKYKFKLKINEPPGTLVYTGEYKQEPLEIELISYNEDGYIKKYISSLDEIVEDGKVHWIDIKGLNDIEFIKEFGLKYGINKMDLEDIVHVSQRSKMVVNNDYIFSVFKMIYIKEDEIIHEHLPIIVIKNLIITLQETKGDVFEHIRNRIYENKGIVRSMKADYLFYILIDALVDQYFDILSLISEKIDDMERLVLKEKNLLVEDIYFLKNELLVFKNAVFPIKDTLDDFLKKESRFISDETKEYFKDVDDHIKHVSENILLYKDILSNIFETYKSNISNDMNKIMMTLTIFSAIFIPLSFLTGFYGMNFSYIPGLTNHFSIYYFVAMCIVLSSIMVIIFKLKKWY